jgi:hypothetical protein
MPGSEAHPGLPWVRIPLLGDGFGTSNLYSGLLQRGGEDEGYVQSELTRWLLEPRQA